MYGGQPITFSEWSFHQVQILGDSITAIKDENGLNIAWVNNRTGEKYQIKGE